MRHGDIPDKEIPAANPVDVISQYEGWINRIVKKYSGLLIETGAVDVEDMKQAGKMALLEAQKTYDPCGGSSFMSWSYKPIRNAILCLFGYDNPGRKRPPLPLLSLDEPTDEAGDETMLDMIQDPDCIIPEEKIVEDVSREEIRAEIHAAVDRMENEKYKTVVKRVWFEGKDKQTIAEELGISLDAVRQCDRNGRGKLCGDYRLRRLIYPLFNVGLTRFRSTLTSAVEEAVLWRERHNMIAESNTGETDH